MGLRGTDLNARVFAKVVKETEGMLRHDKMRDATGVDHITAARMAEGPLDGSATLSRTTIVLLVHGGIAFTSTSNCVQP